MWWEDFLKMRYVFVFCSMFFFVKTEAQNLVPNWSFENYSLCPDNSSQLNRTLSWFSPSLGTPDYFNDCNNPGNFGVPFNVWGYYQLAHTGNAYAGCQFGGNVPPLNFREYIEVQLSDSLIDGKSYCVSFYISLGNYCSMAISNVGCYLSQNSITSSNIYALPVIPQIENPIGNYLSDTLNWMKISGIFIAAGGEQFITIGNFHDDASTDSTSLYQTVNGRYYYYYIDDVSVIRCEDTLPITENNLYVPNAFSPNGDGNNDLFFVRGKNIVELNFAIYSRWGEKVFETINISEGWDGTFRGEKMESAVFAYYLTLTYADGKTEVKKGNISLIR
jgi:gliding motility-associated-like protein